MSDLPKRRLGRTGMEATEVSFGGIPILQQPTDEAVRVLQYAYDQGVNTFDTARGYGDSEAKMGIALEGRECFLMSKSPAREADAIVAEIEETLKQTKRDCCDVYFMHNVMANAEMERVLAPGGALEGLLRAQEQGKIRYTGITGHHRGTLVRLIERAGDQIDTCLFLFNPLETDALDRLVPLCAEMDVGLIAMKAAGGGILSRQQTAVSIKWVLGHGEVACAVMGFGSRDDVDQAVRAAREGPSLSAEEQHVLQDLRHQLERSYCRRCGECMPCPKGINIFSLLVGASMIKRIGWKQLGKRNFMANVERAVECDDCGVCVERCVWNLDIPRLIVAAAEEIRRMA